MDIVISSRVSADCEVSRKSDFGGRSATDNCDSKEEFCIDLELQLPGESRDYSYHSHGDVVSEVFGLGRAVLERSEHFLLDPARRGQIIQGAPIADPGEVERMSEHLLREAGKGVASLLGKLDAERRREGMLAYEGGIQYLASAVSDCGKQGEEVNLFIRCDDPKLEQLPWELVHVESHLALLPHVNVIRTGPSGGRMASIEESLRFDVLDVNMGRTNVGEPIDNGGVPIDPNPVLGVPTECLDEENLTLERIEQELGSEKYTVFHFSGHGTNVPEPALLVSSGEPVDGSSGQFVPENVTAADIGPKLQESEVKLATLLCCEAGIGPEWLGFGAQLLGTYEVPAVVSMQAPVIDHEADRFQEAFYGQLASGATVARAVAEARRQIANRAGQWEGFDWWVPVVHTRDPGICFSPTGEPAQAHKALDELRAQLAEQILNRGANHPDTFETRRDIALHYRQLKQYEQAMETLQSLLADQEKELECDSLDTLETHRDIATTLNDLGRPHPALDKEKALLPKQRRLLGPDHRDTRETRRRIARLHLQLGKSEQAESGHGQQALGMLEAVLADQLREPDHHLDTLESRLDIAAAHEELGSTRQALDVLKELYDDQKKIYVDKDHRTLKIRNEIKRLLRQASEEGSTLYGSGQSKQALEAFEMLLAHQNEFLRPDHPATLITRSNIASTHTKLEQAQKALGMLHELLADQEKILGANHPVTLATLGNTAHTTREYSADSTSEVSGLQEALRVFYDLLATQTRLLGPEHPDTLATRNNIADTLRKLGKFQRALDDYQELVVACKRVLGPDGHLTLTTRYMIGMCLSELDRMGEALEKFEALLPDQERVLGAGRRETLMTRYMIGICLFELDRNGEALEKFEALLPDEERVLGAGHRDTLMTRSMIGGCLFELDREGEALEMHEALLPVRERELGAGHRDTLMTRSMIGGCLFELDRNGEALEMHEALLPDEERVLGAGHRDTLMTRSKIGGCLFELDREGEALEKFEALLPDEERVLGAGHRDTLSTRHNIAWCLYTLGRVGEALEKIEALLPDQERVLGADDRDTLSTRHMIGRCLYTLGRVGEALEKFEALLPDQERVLGADHPNTLRTRQRVEQLRKELDEG